MGDSQISGVWIHSERRLHISNLELKVVMLALHHWVSVLSVMISTDNTTVVAYINKQGGTHSHTLLWLVVDLFLWLQIQAIRARHIPGSRLSKCDCRLFILAKPAHHDRVASPPGNSEPNIQNVGNSAGDMFATVHNTHLPQFMSPVLEPRALAIDALLQDWQGRSIYVSTVSPAQQSHSEA